jgi:DNA-binding NarL/FixJ family response regulator
VKRKKIRLVLVDDHTLVREGIKRMVEDSPDIQVIGESDGYPACMEVIVKRRPDLVLMDIRLISGSGLDACEEIKRLYPEIKVVLLSAFAEGFMILRAIRHKADAYLLKDVNTENIVNAVHRVMAGEKVWDKVIVEFLVENESRRHDDIYTRHTTLTLQEREIAKLVAEGKTNNEIGETMNLKEKTIRNYLSTIMGKLNVTRRTQVAAAYMEQLHSSK